MICEMMEMYALDNAIQNVQYNTSIKLVKYVRVGICVISVEL